MTDLEWQTSENVELMLAAADSWRVSDRAFRLFAASCCRGFPSLQSSIERLADRYGDNRTVSPDEWGATRMAFAIARADEEAGASGDSKIAKFIRRDQAARLRDIIGNAPMPVVWSGCHHCGGRGWRTKIDHDNPGSSITRPCRKCGPSPDMVGLAQDIYENGRWELMPVLADAMLDGGLPGQAFQDHLRGSVGYYEDGAMAYWFDRANPFVPHLTPDRARAAIVHVKGCWALDLILGKS